ncbi:hypothetical protein [Luteolibacter luteus]|uniref:DUF2782 domain-containing protein n=1 Tax=Luteolibacter luteus TaxID=2728835 RepID=A0A858RKS2_9BACT|nr:hypothetical protein [Luteolibacter luteus]QJE97452.1 hypothetical protein HHL09_17220 [Luteolibacter luteus]
MRKLAILAAAFVLQAVAAHAGTIAIKNDTPSPRTITVYQGGKLAGYVDRLKRNKTLLVKINDAGPKPIVVIEVAGEKEYLFVPAKTRTYKVTWLLDMMY